MLTLINKEDYLLAELSGIYSLQFFIEVVQEISALGKKEKINKALIDIRNVDGSPSIIDRYEIGKEISKVWGKNIQAAALANEEVINNMTENVAVNRGSKFQVFTKLEFALAWLEVSNKQ